MPNLHKEILFFYSFFTVSLFYQFREINNEQQSNHSYSHPVQPIALKTGSNFCVILAVSAHVFYSRFKGTTKVSLEGDIVLLWVTLALICIQWEKGTNFNRCMQVIFCTSKSSHLLQVPIQVSSHFFASQVTFRFYIISTQCLK